MPTLSGFATRRLRLTSTVETRVLDTGGPNPPLILIHGLAASIEIWRHVLPALAADYRVIAFDLPGFGEADKPDADYRATTFFVPMLKAFMDAVGLPRAHLVGSSMGASLIVRFAAAYPAHCHGAVLANPGGFGRYIHPFLRVPTLPLIGGALSRPMRAVTAFGVRLALHDRALATADLIDEADAASRLPGAHRAFVRTLRGIANPLTVRDLDIFEAEARRFASPTLILWGRQDRIFPVRQADRARQLMPTARVERLDQVGHYPQLEAPRAFIAHVHSHLSALS